MPQAAVWLIIKAINTFFRVTKLCQGTGLMGVQDVVRDKRPTAGRGLHGQQHTIQEHTYLAIG